MDFIYNFFVEYLFFEGEITIINALLNLLSFSVTSHWNMIFLGFTIGILVRRFSSHIKSWWLLSYPIIFFVAIYPLSDTYTEYHKRNLAVSKEIVREMNYDYDQWKRKNPHGTINPEWVKKLEKDKESLFYFKNAIIINLSDQLFYIIFLALGFLCKKYTFRNAYYNFKSAYKRNLRGYEIKIQQEKNRIRSEKIKAENAIKAEELRVQQLEEKKLEAKIEEERTKQIEAESAVKLKKLDVERPEKEKNISRLIDKLDDL